MRGVKAINDPDVDFSDPHHPVTVPCHFSLTAGIKNCAKLNWFRELL